ncbi:hypothetical protein [Planktothrix agardhii]|nr:hypothetical protein [Planktothrix agardhii]
MIKPSSKRSLPQPQKTRFMINQIFNINCSKDGAIANNKFRG